MQQQNKNSHLCLTPVLYIEKFNQLLTADANELQTSKMAARRFITTPERLLSVSALHWALVEAYNAKFTSCPALSVSSWHTDTVSKLWDLGILHVCYSDKSTWLPDSLLQVDSSSFINSEMENAEQSEILEHDAKQTMSKTKYPPYKESNTYCYYLICIIQYLESAIEGNWISIWLCVFISPEMVKSHIAIQFLNMYAKNLAHVQPILFKGKSATLADYRAP